MFARRQFVLMAALVAFTGSAGADGWPERPVRIIFPYAAGSTGDATARLIARRLSDRFGQPFIVENRVGANRRHRGRGGRSLRSRRLYAPMGCYAANYDFPDDDQGAI